MKFNRFILLMSVLLVAGMGSRPDGEGPQASQYIRNMAPGDRPPDPALPADGPAATLEVLDATEVEPSQYLWQARPVVIFADTPQDPAFVEQLRMIRGDSSQLLLRDVVVVLDSDPDARSAWRRNLRPEGFSLVLLDKDGQVKQRKPAPWSVREIIRAIDKFPLRRQEIGRASAQP